MAGKFNIPKFVDYRDKIKRHGSRKYTALNVESKTTIVIHHSLTKREMSGSNAEGFARFHVDTHGWPSIGYSYVIEPDGTVKFCNDIELETYHVGNHNEYAVGVCLTGDFRNEDPTKAQEESLRNLVNALKKKYSHIKHVKGHNELEGYEYKKCPEFNFRSVLNEKGETVSASEVPGTYEIQKGDTLWSIAKGLEDISIDDLIRANPNVDPKALKVGDKIKLSDAKPKKDEKESKPKKEYKGSSIVDYLNLNGIDSSFGNRRKLARKHGIGETYQGKREQNVELLESMQLNGKKKKDKYPLPDGTYSVKSNDKSLDEVKMIQRALNAAYFKVGDVDGYYGSKTKDAVKRFQSMHKELEDDGIFGPKTKAVLDEKVN